MNSQLNFKGSIFGLIKNNSREPEAEDLNPFPPSFESSALLAAIVQSCRDGIISKDLDGIITSWNKSAEQIFGYTGSEAVGRSIGIIIPPDQIHEEVNILEQIRRGEKVEPFETVRRRKDGSLVDIFLTVSPIWIGGRVIGASKIARDITSRKRMQQELTQAHAALEQHARKLEEAVAERTNQLQQTISELEALSFTISHDLRSPLRAMEGFAQAVLSDPANKLAVSGREYLERVRQAAMRLDKLILEVLAYRETSRSDLPTRTVDLDKLIQEVVHTDPALRAHDVQIEVERPLSSAVGNDSALLQCVSNLLTNAVKFVTPNAIPKIRIWTEKHDSKVRLLIQDNGIGIPQNLQSRIFEPFQRGHPYGGYEGTGMGLAIVRKAIQRMGGSVGVHSEVDHGSTFWLELPAA